MTPVWREWNRLSSLGAFYRREFFGGPCTWMIWRDRTKSALMARPGRLDRHGASESGHREVHGGFLRHSKTFGLAFPQPVVRPAQEIGLLPARSRCCGVQTAPGERVRRRYVTVLCSRIRSTMLLLGEPQGAWVRFGRRIAHTARSCRSQFASGLFSQRRSHAQ